MAAVRASRTSSLLGRYHPAGIHSPPAGFQPYVQPRRHPAHPKQASRFEGFPTRAHVCFTYTLAWRTHPIQIHFQPSFCPPQDRLTSTACVSGPDFTHAGAHAAASCKAPHEPRSRCCANPARSSKWLRPLLGLCPLSDAVFVAIQRTHSRVT